MSRAAEPSESGLDLATELSSGAQDGTQLLGRMPRRRPQRRTVRPRSEDLTTAAGHDVVQRRPEHPSQISGGRALGTHAWGKQRCIGCGKVKTELLDRFPDGGSDHHTDAAKAKLTAGGIAGVLAGHAIHDAAGNAAAISGRMLHLGAVGV
jgi:hypothetical protein